eukprot:5916425-Prymnesium_polylepis.1
MAQPLPKSSARRVKHALNDALGFGIHVLAAGRLSRPATGGGGSRSHTGSDARPAPSQVACRRSSRLG